MNKLVDKAFESVDRAKFMLDQYCHLYALDQPFPIGFGQTISQPTTVRLMLEWLDLKAGQKVLDVGSGSGWTSALLAHIVGPNGCVVAVERIAQLVELGRGNCARIGTTNVQFHRSIRSQLGWPNEAPYDRILVSASATRMPLKLIEQLKSGGKMVIPIKSDVVVLSKNSRNNSSSATIHPGFAFVPLVS